MCALLPCPLSSPELRVQSRGSGINVHKVVDSQALKHPRESPCTEAGGPRERKGRSFPQKMLRGRKALEETRSLPVTQRCGNTKQLRQMATVKREPAGPRDAAYDK